MKSRDVTVRDAQAKIEKLKRMMTETEMLEAQAELQEMATGMIASIGGSGDTLNRVEEYLTERRDKAAGARAWRVDARHLQGGADGGRAAGARRRRARRVRRRYGIDMPAEKPAEAEAPAAPPAREMGPEKQG